MIHKRHSLLSESSSLTRFEVIDQLRGFLVLSVAVAILLPVALDEWTDRSRWNLLRTQLETSIWHGCTMFDLAKSGFIFVAGISTSLSLSRRLKQEQRSLSILAHVARHSIALYLLGIIVDGGIVTLQMPLRFGGYFQQIAGCKFTSGVLGLFFGRRAAFLVGCIGLMNYAIAVELNANEDQHLTIYQRNVVDSANSSLVVRVDQRFLAGRKYFGSWDPQGLLTTVPAIAIALFGLASASLIDGENVSLNWMERWGKPSFAGLALIQGGLVLSRWQPLNSWLLTAPFVIIVFGACLAGIGILSLVDQMRFEGGLFSFLGRIGRNSLALMVLLHLVDYFAFAFLVNVSDRFGLSSSHGHTVVALLTIVGMFVWCRPRPVASPLSVTSRSSDHVTIPRV